jgi:hypothetical protein
VSETIRTLDDGRKLNDLPLFSEKGGEKSVDESEDDITEFRGRPAKSRTEKASDIRNRRRMVEMDTTDERTLSKYLPTFQGAFVNSRIDMTKYPEMIYGWCFSRVIHFVVALRAEHPGSRIFISKYDFSDAYRRVAHTARAAAQTILVMGQVAYVMLRLAFGGSRNPPACCTFSEMVTDLANEIPLCPSWDPSEIRSPAQHKTPSP